MKRHLLLIILTSALVAGCVRFISSNAPNIEEDPALEDQRRDASLQAGDANLPSGDATLPSGDATLVTSDGSLLDASSPLSDAAISKTGCVVSATVAYSYAANMIVCHAPQAPADACHAEAQLCNVAGGWHLCPASEFLARGGKTKKAPFDAWLKSSLRNGGAYYDPSDELCLCLESNSSHSMAVAHDCANYNSMSSVGYNYAALKASSRCTNFDVHKQVPAYWDWEIPTAPLAAAVCCQ